MYHMSGKKIPKEFNNKISQFVSGMKRTVAPQNSESGESLDEEKKSMSYEVHKNLYKFIF